MLFHRLDLRKRHIDSFFGLADICDQNFVVIDLGGNDLTNFEYFGTHPYLTELLLEGNKIASFRGLTKQPSLETLQLRGSPICQHPYYRLMALMVVGFSLREIDGARVTAEERQLVRACKYHAAVAVSHGWLYDGRALRSAAYKDLIEHMQFQRRLHANDFCVPLRDALRASQPKASRRADTRGRCQYTRVDPAAAAAPVSPADSSLALTSASPVFSPQMNAVDSIGANELRECVLLYDRGIRARLNTSPPASEAFVNACLQLSCDRLTLLSFMKREVLLDMALEEASWECLEGGIDISRDRDGVEAQVRISDTFLCAAVQHALSVMAHSGGRRRPLLNDAAAAPTLLLQHHRDPSPLPAPPQIRHSHKQAPSKSAAAAAEAAPAAPPASTTSVAIPARTKKKSSSNQNSVRRSSASRHRADKEAAYDKPAPPAAVMNASAVKDHPPASANAVVEVNDTDPSQSSISIHFSVETSTLKQGSVVATPAAAAPASSPARTAAAAPADVLPRTEGKHAPSVSSAKATTVDSSRSRFAHLLIDSDSDSDSD